MSVRTMYRIHGDEIDFVVVEIPDHTGFCIRQLKRQIELYKGYFNTNVIFSLEHISRYQRKVLIANQFIFTSSFHKKIDFFSTKDILFLTKYIASEKESKLYFQLLKDIGMR